MSDTKHTPGPWKIVDGPQYGYNRCTRVESDHGQFGTVICERFTADTNGEVCDEYMTNLRLIAAAPELLAALVEMVDEVRHHNAGIKSPAQYETVAFLAAVAAITKATKP